jgi:trimeric autotransporter adhesin
MRHARLFACVFVCLLLSIPVLAQQAGSTAAALNRVITFNGTLKDAEGNPRVGTIGITVSLYTSQEGGDPLWRESQMVQTDEQGRYTVLLGATEKDGLPLDVFGTGKAQWLGLQAERQAEEPRVLLMTVPYALKAADADTVGGRPLSSFVLYEDLDKAAKESTAPSVLAVIQSGGSAGRGEATTAGSSPGGTADRKLFSSTRAVDRFNYYETGTNTYMGEGAGASITSGTDNSFFGSNAGYANTTGNNNAFFGRNAGNSNTTANQNSFFGQNAGYSNTEGASNSFFGSNAGYANTTGYRNSFYGWGTGNSNTTGYNNVFIGASAGNSNTTGTWNSFIGASAGFSNTTGSQNSFFGQSAGTSNSTGFGNSFFGRYAGFLNTTGGNNSFFGLSAGSANTTGVQNSFFGSGSGLSNTTGNYNCFFGDGSGSSNTIGYANVFMGQDAGVANTEGYWNSFLGDSAGQENISGYQNTFVGRYAGVSNTAGASNTMLGNSAGLSNSVENGNTLVGVSSDGAPGVNTATAIGYRAKVTQSNSLVLGSINGVNGATADTYVGIGTTAPSRLLEVRKDQNGSTYLQVTNMTDAVDVSRSRFALVAGTVTQEMQSIARDGGYFGTTSNHPFRIYTNKNTRMTIDTSGNVGIGTTTPTARLHVVGNLRVTGAIQYGAPDEEMPDYVFEPNYPLMPVEALGDYVAKVKHLPNVPSAAEVKLNGLNLGQFQSRLLEKIEELTLYTVQQAKANRQQGVVLAQQRAVLTNQQSALEQKEGEIQMLKARLAALEQAVQKLSARDRN